MHRHGYQGRKLQRDRDQRRALIRGQVTSLVIHEQIVTTLPKAKEVAPVFERLVTKAKKGDLHNYRQVHSFLLTDKAAQKLSQVIAPTFKERQGGYTRIVKLGNRRGDNAPMAALMVVKDDNAVAPKIEAKAAAQKAPARPKKTPANAQTAEHGHDQAKPQTAPKAAPQVKRRTNA